MTDFVIVPYQDSSLSPLLATALKTKIFPAAISSFSDSETRLVFGPRDELSQKTALLVARFSFDQGCVINSQLFDLMLLAGTIKKRGAEKIIAVLPYFPYGRHDKDEGGGIGLIDVFGHMLKGAGVDEVVSCESHSPEIFTQLPFESHEVPLSQFWADAVSYILQSSFELPTLDSVMIVSPDEGGLKRAKSLGSILGVEAVHATKKRVSIDETVAESLVGIVKDKEVILYDDIIDTAGTAINACNLLLERGAKQVVGCFSHGVLSGNAREKIEESNFEGIFVTNSVLLAPEYLGEKVQVVSIDEYLCSQLKNYLLKA